MKAKTTQEWVKEFEGVGIPCGPVNTIPQVAADPQVAARDMIVEVNHPAAGKFKVANTPFKFSRSQCQVEQASPELGEHTEEILTSLLRMSRKEVSKLMESRVI